MYCSESIALAFVESMIRRQGTGFNHDFKIAHIEIPDHLSIKKIRLEELETGWNSPADLSKSQHAANNWFTNLESLSLSVPSAVLNVCNNYVINTIHPDFSKVKLSAITPLMPDPRIEEILKRSK